MLQDNLFNRKVADFVVLDKQFNVVAIVELDDASHKDKEEKDADRDALIAEAGYRVIRYKRTPDLEQVQKDFGIIKVAELVEEPLAEPKTHLVSDAFIIETDTNEQKIS